MKNIPTGLLVMLGLVSAAIILFLVDRLLLWMERKGWIFYRGFEPRISGGTRGVMGSFQEIIQPEIREVKEAQRQSEAAESDSQSDGQRTIHR